MVNWLIIGLLVAAVFILVKVKYIKHKLFLISFAVVLIFLYISFAAVTAGQEVDLSSMEGIEALGRSYLNWLSNSFVNLKTLTTNAIKMDWQTNVSIG